MQTVNNISKKSKAQNCALLWCDPIIRIEVVNILQKALTQLMQFVGHLFLPLHKGKLVSHMHGIQWNTCCALMQGVVCQVISNTNILLRSAVFIDTSNIIINNSTIKGIITDFLIGTKPKFLGEKIEIK